MLDNITIFSKQVSCYDLSIDIGTVIGLLVYLCIALIKTKSVKRVVCSVIFATVLLNLGAYLGNFIRGLSVGEVGGISEIFSTGSGSHFIGRVLMVVIFLPVVYRYFLGKDKKEWVLYMDFMSFYLVVQHIFNRLGCLLNGCCEGKEYRGFLSFEYPIGIGFGPGYDYPMYPTQLFEIISMVILLGVCIYMFGKRRHIIVIFEIWFAVTIFVSEFMMLPDHTVYILGLNAIQYSAIVLLIIAFVTKAKITKSGE